MAQTGAEVIIESTKMKAATKLVLNMISTTVMIKMGKVYANFMIYLKSSNTKLRNKMIYIVSELLNCSSDYAIEILDKNEWNIQSAVESDKKKEKCCYEKY